jgi:hypothetical protein
MATFPSSYVNINASTSDRVNAIVDNMLTPRLMTFRQIMIYDEEARNVSARTWKLTYPAWNTAFTPQVMLNGQVVTPASIDYIMGSVTMTSDMVDGDIVLVTYCFDWFSIGILQGLIIQSIDIINNSGTDHAPTNYNITNAPSNWDGVIADIVFAMCMEKLLVDYEMWYGRIIFAIGANNLEEGGGDITGQLETLKSNAEERANIALNNNRFKIGFQLAYPTSIYYAAVRGIGRQGTHGGRYGKLRGWTSTKYI